MDYLLKKIGYNDNPGRAKLWQQFNLLEDEQISMDRLINKMKNLLKEISKTG